MSRARDRYDSGKSKTEQHDANKRALYIRWGTQRECERYTLAMALQSPDRHVPGTLAYELVIAYAAERSV